MYWQRNLQLWHQVLKHHHPSNPINSKIKAIKPWQNEMVSHILKFTSKYHSRLDAFMCMYVYVYVYIYIYILIFWTFRSFSSKDAKSLKSWYNRLKDCQRLKLPIVGLTGTKTKAIETLIIENVTLINRIPFRSSPEKLNIKYHVHNVNSMNIRKILFHIYDDKVVNGYKAQKVLRFCTRGFLCDLSGFLELVTAFI